MGTNTTNSRTPLSFR